MPRSFVRLTRAQMRHLPPGRSIHEHGITYSRTPRGDGVFTVNIMVDGVRVHRVIGRESEGVTRRQAEIYIEERRSEARNNRLALPKGRKLSMNFRDAAREYLRRLEQLNGKDLKMKRQRLELHLIPFFGELPLIRISSMDVERYKHQRLQESVCVRPRGKECSQPMNRRGKTKPATINRELAVFSHISSMAVEWGWIDRRLPRIKPLAEARSRLTYLTVEQIATVLECAKRDSSPIIHAFIKIGVSTAMRRGEILAIRREHIDSERRTIHIPKAKGGTREQPITADLASFLDEYLRSLPKDSPWLFSSPTSATGHATDIRKPFRRVITAAGLDPDAIVRHTLRHTAITHLVQAGIDLPTVKRISGHKTLAMVERYAHQNGAHVAAAMDTLSARLKLA